MVLIDTVDHGFHFFQSSSYIVSGDPCCKVVNVLNRVFLEPNEAFSPAERRYDQFLRRDRSGTASLRQIIQAAGASLLDLHPTKQVFVKPKALLRWAAARKCSGPPSANRSTTFWMKSARTILPANGKRSPE